MRPGWLPRRLLALLLLSSLDGMAAAGERSTFAGLENRGIREMRVKVKGMVCSFCAQGMVKTLRTREEVEDVNVSLADQTLQVYTKAGKSLTDEQIRDLIREAGFKVEQIDR